MTQPGKHLERETLAAAIKGLPMDEHLRQKSATNSRDPADEFAAWHERFRHELASEFGELADEEDEDSVKKYIQNMRKQFRLRLR